MVPLEKLYNTIPAQRELSFHFVWSIEVIVKAIWGLNGVWKFDFGSKF